MYRMPPMPPQPMMPPGNQNMNNMNSMNNMNQGGPGPSKPLFPAAAQVSMVQDYKQCHMFTGSCNNYGVGKSCIHLQHSDNFSKAQSCDTLAMANSCVLCWGGGHPEVDEVLHMEVGCDVLYHSDWQLHTKLGVTARKMKMTF